VYNILKCQNCSFGITGTVYSWLQSYLSGRTQSVRIGTHSSPATSSPVGIPQAPSLSQYYPLSPISTIARSHHVSQQQYADDMQLFLALFPTNHSQSINVLQSCLNSLHIWFCENGMAILIQINQLIFCSVPHKGLNLCPGFNLLM